MGNVSNISVGMSNQFAEEKGVDPSKAFVEKKLLKVYPDLKGNQLQEQVESLSDSTLVKSNYFDHLLKRKDAAAKTVQEEEETFGQGFRNEASRDRSIKCMTTTLDQVQQLQVKLVLYELKNQPVMKKLARYIHGIHSFEFGPFHAAIQIGDVRIDWGPNSLVIPRRVSPAHDEDSMCNTPILVTNVHADSALEASLMSGIGPRASPETIQEGFEKVHKLLHSISEEKEHLIDELAKLVVRYNTKFEYGLFSNNCHHFVLDVLTVLGITDHKDVFQGKIKEYAAILTAGDKKNMTEFNSHADLNTHVQENIETMSKDYLEWAYSHYLLFHAWSKKMPKEDAWRCDSGSCMCENVFQKLEPQV